MRAPASQADALTASQRAAADAGEKVTIPFVDAAGTERPFLDFVVHALAEAGFRKVCLVIGDEQGHVRRRYAATRPAGIRVVCAWQAEPLGTANAVAAAEDFVANRPFVVVNGDNLYPVTSLRRLLMLEGSGLLVFERDELARSSALPVDRLAAFAMPVVGPGETLRAIVEKPDVETLRAAGPRALVSMNAWKFDSRLFAACRDVPPSVRGELELPDAVRLALQRGVTFRAVRAQGPVLDLTGRADIANVATVLRTLHLRS
jgi:glucose-1-phosphate thymidylyltransferase